MDTLEPFVVKACSLRLPPNKSDQYLLATLLSVISFAQALVRKHICCCSNILSVLVGFDDQQGLGRDGTIRRTYINRSGFCGAIHATRLERSVRSALRHLSIRAVRAFAAFSLTVRLLLQLGIPRRYILVLRRICPPYLRSFRSAWARRRSG